MLVSDALVARGHSVVHLGMGKRPAEHKARGAGCRAGWGASAGGSQALQGCRALPCCCCV